MPIKSICKYPGCRLSTNGRYCIKHIKKGPPPKLYAKARLSSSKRGYDHHWNKERRAFLLRRPLCVKCLEHGSIVRANTVDHIIPHKGDMTLFWDVSNWQSLCTLCHRKKTASEDGGFGNPVK